MKHFEAFKPYGMIVLLVMVLFVGTFVIAF